MIIRLLIGISGHVAVFSHSFSLYFIGIFFFPSDIFSPPFYFSFMLHVYLLECFLGLKGKEVAHCVLARRIIRRAQTF